MTKNAILLLLFISALFSCKKEEAPVEVCPTDADLGHFEIPQTTHDFFNFREYENWDYLVFKNGAGEEMKFKVRDTLAGTHPVEFLKAQPDTIRVSCDTSLALLAYSREDYDISIRNVDLKIDFQFSISVQVTYNQPFDTVGIKEHLFIFYTNYGSDITKGIRFDSRPSGFEQLDVYNGGNSNTFMIDSTEYKNAYTNGTDQATRDLVLQEGIGLVAFKDEDGVWWKFDRFL